ncbi:MAG: capsule biosynthesis protein [Desulfovibrio sp.]|nr:capsule biosynthesis protein [Desulfovibrio sp.]
MMRLVDDIVRDPNVRSARRKFRRLFRKGDRLQALLIIFVYIPTGLLAVYLFVFFSDMYVSESRFALRYSDGASLSGGSLGGSLLASPLAIYADTFIIQEYITSVDMMEKVESAVQWRRHYSDKTKDVYSRLKAAPTREELLAYWQWLVTVTFDMDKGIVVLQVKAYTPETAKAVNGAVLRLSEDLVNQMNDRAHQDAIRLAREEVNLAERRLARAQAAIQRFRDDKSVLDPQAVAAGLEGVVAKLEAEAAATEAELAAALRVMRENTPSVVNIKTRLQALRGQLVAERSRLAGLAARGASLSSLVGDYAQLSTEEEFARKQLVEAMASLEKARVLAVAQSRYIVPFQSPTLAEESEYPRPVLFTVCGFFGLLIGLGICSLVIAAVRDHMGA